MEIRRAEEKDIAGMKKLLEQVLLIHHVGRPDIFKEEGRKYTVEELSAMMKVEENPIFVCVEGDKVLGHCFCQTIDRKESECAYAYRTLYIDDLCVDEACRGMHIGTKLYEFAKNYGKEQGYYNLTLHAWECNQNAVGFYRHLGMQTQQYTMEEVL